MKVNKISNIFVPVTSIERSNKFYEDIIGLKQIYNDENMSFLQIKNNDSQPQLLLHYQPQVNNEGDQLVLNFEISDLEIHIKEIEKQGVEIIEYPIKREWGIIEATILDPDGYRCILSQQL